MKWTFFLLFFLPPLCHAEVPWKVHAGVGLTFPESGPEGAPRPPEPFVEGSVFFRVLEPQPPEYFQAGARLAWDPRGVELGVGVRHKLYFVPSSSSGQEVLLGRRFGAGTPGAWTLAGRFGFGLPWSGREGDLPSTDLDLVWGVEWTPEREAWGSHWGVALGLGGGEP